jgi:pimeloyl-ACP methyl ester carboxylesterase
MLRARIVLAFVLAVSLTLPACGPSPALPPGPLTWNHVVFVEQRWLQLRMARPPGPPVDRPLVLFVTGDGGWRGKDLDAFRHLIGWGFPVAGFSAPDYLGHLAGGAETLSTEGLAHDFTLVIDAARQTLDLPPDGRTILVGVSRGADLAAVAATQRSLRPSIGGVLLIGLTREEEYVRQPHQWWRGSRAASTTGKAAGGPDEVLMAEPYVALRRLTAPVSLIQSSHDEYVPAAEARTLFGPDTATRQFHPIDARNHSFSNARDALYRQMASSLDWLAGFVGPHSKGTAS